MLLGLCESTKNVPLTEGISWWLTKTINCLQSTALTHLHLRREAYPAWCMDTDPCIIPTGPCWMRLRGILCGPLLRPPGLWPAVARGIYNLLKRWTVVTDPNGTGMFLCYGFLVELIQQAVCILAKWCGFKGVNIQYLSRIGLLWHEKMMTSSNGNIFRVIGLCAGNSPVTGEFPAQWPVTRSYDVFFDLRLNKRLSKQSWGWWFETLLHPL